MEDTAQAEEEPAQTEEELDAAANIKCSYCLYAEVPTEEGQPRQRQRQGQRRGQRKGTREGQGQGKTIRTHSWERMLELRRPTLQQ